MSKRGYSKAIRVFGKILFTVVFLVIFVVIREPMSVLARPSDSLEITGDGISYPIVFTLDELQQMQQYEHVYSTINTWPTKMWYTARGVKLRDLLESAGIKEDAKLVKFVSTDGYEVTLTVKELLKDKRYYFPGLKENHPSDGSIPGSSEGAVEVEPILSLVSAEGSTNPDEMNDRDRLLLVFGQRAVTEQTNNSFLKYVSRIEVTTSEPEKWDAPKANVPSGTVVPIGTLITLSNKGNNEDKIYYTIDGSTPTVDSPMFNWSASRWWPLRNDLESVNSPIRITEDTVIKAITVGPGREDSEVVTFTFKVDPTGQVPDPTKVSGGPPTGVVIDRSAVNLQIGGTTQLEATVAPFNADDQRVIWTSSDTSVATVDTRGLVTVVGQGTAIITVMTADGKHRASCVVKGPIDEKRDENVEVEGNDLPPDENQESVKPSTVAEEEQSFEEPLPVSSDEGSDNPVDKASQEEAAAPASTSEDESFIPEGNWSYLAKVDEPSPATDGFSGQEKEKSGQVQVFEISIDTAVPFPLPESRRNLDFFTAAVIIILFISGAGKRYIQYVKEL